jgi:hypothetical protein
LKEKPVCADCSVGKLKLIDPPPPPVQPKKKQRVENHKRYELLAELKTKLIECLQGRCLSSKELFQACGKNHYNDYDSFIWFLRILHLEGSIYSCRWRANGSNYHVLPDEKELLYRRIGYPPEERILKVLEETKALGVSKIARRVGLSRATVYAVCQKIEQKSAKIKMQKTSSGEVIAYINPDLNN